MEIKGSIHKALEALKKVRRENKEIDDALFINEDKAQLNFDSEGNLQGFSVPIKAPRIPKEPENPDSLPLNNV